MSQPIDPLSGPSQLFHAPPSSNPSLDAGAVSSLHGEEEAKREAERQAGSSVVENAATVVDAASSGFLNVVGEAAGAVAEGAASVIGSIVGGVFEL